MQAVQFLKIILSVKTNAWESLTMMLIVMLQFYSRLKCLKSDKVIKLETDLGHKASTTRSFYFLTNMAMSNRLLQSHKAACFTTCFQPVMVLSIVQVAQAKITTFSQDGLLALRQSTSNWALTYQSKMRIIWIMILTYTNTDSTKTIPLRSSMKKRSAVVTYKSN